MSWRRGMRGWAVWAYRSRGRGGNAGQAKGTGQRGDTASQARRGGVGTVLAALACVLGGALGRAQEAPEPADSGVSSTRELSGFPATVRALLGANLVVLEDGRTVRLQGLSLPTPAVRPDGFRDRLRDFLEPRLVGRTVWIVPDSKPVVDDDAQLLGMVYEGTTPAAADGRSVNEACLAAGAAILSLRSKDVARLDALVAAAAEGRRERRGWWGRTSRRLFHRWGEMEPAPQGTPPGPIHQPYLAGAVLGLHDRDPTRSYRPDLEQLHELGFRHVCFLFTAFLEDAEASRIDRWHPRTVTDDRLVATIGDAKALGMSVMLLPIVLLLDSGENDWRGTLRPADEARFWLSYDRFLSHYLDLAEVAGAEIVSVGSEFGSLEDRTETWERILTNARGRFGGSLTYSANWDHVHVPRFFGGLDFIGMTAYFSLTEERDPDRDALVSGWRTAAAKLRATVQDLPRPVVFTEIGYASQDGINTNPWNYFMNPGDVDLQEQADCFRAFRQVAPEMEWLKGAYWFEWYDEGGPDDGGYAPRGKPAMAEWREWAAYRGK